MTIVTGSNSFIDGHESLLHEHVQVQGDTYRVPHVKLTSDSVVQIPGTLDVGALPNPLIISGSAVELSFPTYEIYDYVDMTYTGTTMITATFKRGGSSGTTLATLNLIHDGLGNLLTVTKT